MTRTPGRRVAAALTLLAAAMALSGCMKMHVDLTLNPDDTASASMVMAVSNAAAEEQGQDLATVPDLLEQQLLSGGTPEGTTVEPYSDGSFTGVTLTSANSPLNKVAGLDALGATGTDEALSIVREGDDYVVSGTMDMSTALEGADATALALLDTMDIKVSITFPGAVSSHDGALEGTTVTWVPKLGEANPINARGSAVAGGASSPALLWALVAVGVLAVAVVAVVLVARRKKPAVAADGPATSIDDVLVPAGPDASSAPLAAPAAPAAPVTPAAPGAQPAAPDAQPAAPTAPPAAPPAPPATPGAAPGAPGAAPQDPAN